MAVSNEWIVPSPKHAHTCAVCGATLPKRQPCRYTKERGFMCAEPCGEQAPAATSPEAAPAPIAEPAPVSDPVTAEPVATVPKAKIGRKAPTKAAVELPEAPAEAIVVDAAALRSVLQVVKPAVSTDRGFPLLRCVLLQSNGTLRATNLEIDLSVSLPVSFGEGAPPLLVNHAELLGALPKVGAVTMTQDVARRTVTVAADGTEATLCTCDAAQFPALSEIPATFAPMPELPAAVRRVVHAASADMLRPYLQTVYVSPAGEAMATDGARIGFAPCTNPLGRALLLPKSTCAKVLAKMTAPEVAAVAVAGREYCWVRDGNLLACIRMVEGTYPDLRKLLPKAYPTEGRFAPADLAAKLAKVPDDASVTLHLNGRLEIQAKGKGEGPEFRSAVPAERTGPELTIGFNPRYIREALQACEAPEVVLQADGPKKPVMLTAGAYQEAVLPLITC